MANMDLARGTLFQAFCYCTSPAEELCPRTQPAARRLRGTRYAASPGGTLRASAASPRLDTLIRRWAFWADAFRRLATTAFACINLGHRPFPRLHVRYSAPAARAYSCVASLTAATGRCDLGTRHMPDTGPASGVGTHAFAGLTPRTRCGRRAHLYDRCPSLSSAFVIIANCLRLPHSPRYLRTAARYGRCLGRHHAYDSCDARGCRSLPLGAGRTSTPLATSCRAAACAGRARLSNIRSRLSRLCTLARLDLQQPHLDSHHGCELCPLDTSTFRGPGPNTIPHSDILAHVTSRILFIDLLQACSTPLARTALSSRCCTLTGTSLTSCLYCCLPTPHW